MRVGLSAWSMQLHPDWDATREPLRLQLSAAEDGGELELSCSLKEHGKVSQIELRECIAQLNRTLEPEQKVEYGPFSGLRVAGSDEPLGVCWWFLASGPLLLRGFYNGWQRASATEREQIEAMLATLQRESEVL